MENILNFRKIFDYNRGEYLVRIAIRTGSPVFQVTFPVLRALSGYSNAASSVGHPSTEVVDARGLIGPGKSPLIVLALVRIIRLDMSDMMS